MGPSMVGAQRAKIARMEDEVPQDVGRAPHRKYTGVFRPTKGGVYPCMDNVFRGDGHRTVSLLCANVMSVAEFAISTRFFCVRIKLLALRPRCCQCSSPSLWRVGISTSPILVPVFPIVPIWVQVRGA